MLNKSVLIGVLALAASAVTANAGVILENGGFESYTGGSPAPSQLGSGAGYTKITDWTLSPSNGYAFLFGSGTATTTGSYSPEFTTAVKLWGWRQLCGRRPGLQGSDRVSDAHGFQCG
jgi:hypothetical protein